MLMGSKRSCYIARVMICILFLPLIQSLDNYSSASLDSFIHDYAYKAIVKPRTGILYNIALPANFSTMEVSIIRLRSGSFWARGANFSSSFHIPPRIIPMPFVKRLALVYQNLGNWSSYYYNVPNYTFVTPVVGFRTYDASNSSARGSTMLKLSIREDPILVRFPHIDAPRGENVTMRCVRFGIDGLVEFSNMTISNVCIVRDQGHFTIVVPSVRVKTVPARKKKLWKLWVIGFVVGVIGLVLVVLVGILIYKLVRMKRIGEMEKQSERSEALETMWVGMSKMPAATGIRTQPMLENDYLP